MSSPKRTTARSDRQKTEVREMMLNTARQIVLREGFTALSIRNLAKASGYVPGTIYLYFKNRDAIVRELCLQGFAELSEQLEPIVETADPRERLRALLFAYADFALQNPETYRLSFMEDPKFAEALLRATPLESEHGAGRRAFMMIVGAVQALKERGDVRADEDETLLAEVFWTSVHGVVSLKLIYPAFPTMPTEVLLEKTVESLLEGLRPSGRGDAS